MNGEQVLGMRLDRFAASRPGLPGLKRATGRIGLQE
jgi:hypothetical protein